MAASTRRPPAPAPAARATLPLLLASAAVVLPAGGRAGCSDAEGEASAVVPHDTLADADTAESVGRAEPEPGESEALDVTGGVPDGGSGDRLGGGEDDVDGSAPGDSVADGGADSLLLGEAPVDSEDVAEAVVVAVLLPVAEPLGLADGGREAVLERDGVEP